jgi:hypothetical protein
VVLADHDDPDITRVVTLLADRGVPSTWLKLGLDSSEYDVTAHMTNVSLRGRGVTVDSMLVARAPVILYRRWRLSPPAPPISFMHPDDPAGFGQGEWTATVNYALWAWRHASRRDTRWGNPPGTDYERMALYQLALESGFAVPPTRLATLHPTIQRTSVVKPIATNEQVGEDKYFPTTELTEPQLVALTGARSDCPHLVQHSVTTRIEVRAIYSFGTIGAVALTRPHTNEDSIGPIDIRYAKDIARTSWSLPEDVTRCCRALARRSHLEYFAIDLLLDHNGEYWLIDVTPDGCVTGLDDAGDTLISSLVEGIATARHDTSIHISP